MQQQSLEKKAISLAYFIKGLYRRGVITARRARNALDRLALRMENAGEYEAAEEISMLYMQCA